MKGKLYGEKFNTSAFTEFVKKCEEQKITVHSFRYIKDGVLMSGADFAPYSAEDRLQVYSLSKSFTSVACGICIDRGLFKVTDRMCDIFPEKMPEVIDERLAKMTLGDVLSMQSGHERCYLDTMLKSGDTLRDFFSHEMKYEPGTTFVYSTGGTLVCGAVVTRKTGLPLDEFLYENMFSHLGCKMPEWDKTDDGICHGGVGLRVSIDDITAFGKMLLAGGVYNGKRIVSEEYLKDATSAHSVDKNNGSIDWISGYGYQFWLNSKGGFRADGAFGQLCIVLPETNEIFSILCEAGNMQNEVTAIFDYMSACRKTDTGSREDAEKLVNGLYSAEKGEAAEYAKYGIEAPESRLYEIELIPDGEELVIRFHNDFGINELRAGNGQFIKNPPIALIGLTPTITMMRKDGAPEPFAVHAAFEKHGNVTEITFRHYNAPHTQVWRFEKGKLTVTPTYGDLIRREYNLK